MRYALLDHPLRRIVKRTLVPKTCRKEVQWVEVTLDCGHVRRRERSGSIGIKFAHCPECPRT